MPSLNIFNDGALPFEYNLSDAFQSSDTFAAANGMNQNCGNQVDDVHAVDMQSEGMQPLVPSYVRQKSPVGVTHSRRDVTEDTSMQMREAADLVIKDCSNELASEQGIEVSSVASDWIGRRLVRATSRNVLSRQLSNVESCFISEDSTSKQTEVCFTLFGVFKF